MDDDRQRGFGDARAVAASSPRPEVLAVHDVSSVPKLGILASSFVGAVAATAIVVTAFGAVSEILLPLVFAAVLAVPFTVIAGKAVSRLRARGFLELVADRAEPAIQRVLD
jgi:hypothetical protein